jgi:catechol 2,3-dioxygenase-like lactoylglutathione lyase family enzyme
MRIKLTGIYVDDQDKARTFYTDVLDFKVKTDAAYGEGAAGSPSSRRTTRTVSSCCCRPRGRRRAGSRRPTWRRASRPRSSRPTTATATT